MCTVGGNSCDVEFDAFLLANPDLEASPPIDIDDPAYFYSRFFCTTGEVRFYRNKPQPCIDGFIEYLRQNPGVFGLNDAGNAFFGATTQAGADSLVRTSVGLTKPFAQYRCVDGTIRIYVLRNALTLGSTGQPLEDSIYALVLP